MPSGVGTGASYGYSMDPGKGISVMVTADGRQAESGLKHTQKALTRTAETAKKTGDEGQKAMTRWGKAMEKAGNAAYDFGNQTFQSMTVADAVKEYVAGMGEMYIVGEFNKVKEGIAAAQAAWGMFNTAMSGDTEKLATQWDSFWGNFGVKMNTAALLAKSSIEEIDFSGALGAAAQKGDWTMVQTIMAKKLETGDYSPVDAAIQAAIGAGDYTTAASLISKSLSGYDYSDVGKSIASAISTAKTSTTEVLAGMAERLREYYNDATASGTDYMYQTFVNVADDATFKDRLQEALDRGWLTAQEAMVLQNARANLEMARDYQDQMRIAVENWTAYLKQPSLYAGVGTAMYNTIIAEWTALGGG